MAEILLWIIFIVTFYCVFKLIWNNVTTVSYSGLGGFLKSWGNQLFWAFMIAAIVTTIAAKILESIFNFGRGLNFDFYDVLILGVVLYVLYAIFSSSDAFDRKTFRENYNRHVIELSEQLNLNYNVTSYFSHESPGDLVDLNDTREVNELTLAEDFIAEGSSKLVQVPSMLINHHVNKSGNYTSIKIFLKSKRDEFYSKSRNEANYAGQMGSILFMEKLIAEIAFTAAIEAVAEGKSRAIENNLLLINEHGAFGFLRYTSDEDKTVAHSHTEDGIEYIVSCSSNGDVSLKMLKKTSEDK